MANTMRWRYQDTKPVTLPVDSSTIIEIGDLIWLDTDDAKSAAGQADQGSKSLNQEAFHDNFVGVAMQQSQSGETNPLRVATSGVFEFDCTSGTFEIGDLIGAEEAVSGTELESQLVDAAGSVNLAIGRCVKRVGTASTKVFVEICSTVLRGGPQAAA